MVSRTGLIWAGFAVAASVLLFALLVRPPRAGAAKPAPDASAAKTAPPVPPESKGDAASESRTMHFQRDGEAAKLIVEVERATGADRSTVALKKVGEATWACLLVEAPERYADTDREWTLADFPTLAKRGFAAPPEPYGRTMSVYKSLAKSALNSNRARGDRLVVIVCPKVDWPELNLEWPAPQPAGSDSRTGNSRHERE